MTRTLFTIALILALTNCASLEKVFEGNTKSDFGEYGLKEKRDYRAYRQYQKLREHDEEKEKLKQLETESSVLKVTPSHSDHP